MTNADYIEHRVSLLKKIPLFMGLHKAILKRVADIMDVMEFGAGHHIFFKGEKGDAIYIIEYGQVSVNDGEFELSRLGPNEIFGEYALIDNKARSASIMAEEPVRLYRLDRNDFINLISENEEVIRGLLVMFVNRLRDHDILEKKLDQQKRQISDQKQALEELNEEKNHLMAIIAHDLRNPLTSTLALTDFLISESEKFSEDQKECLEVMAKAIKRMNHMVQKILDVRAIEAREDQLNLEKVNLADILSEVYASFHDRMEEKQITGVLNLSDVHAEVDRYYLLQIVENLVSNAIKFSPQGSKVFFNIWLNEGKAHIGIKDEGPGISREDQKKLFHKFQTLDAKPTGNETSTGIGLSVVKKFTEMMNGKVWCESDEGKGSKFVVAFVVV
ncbi:ATP-binding protein [Bacteroidota bacterium]